MEDMKQRIASLTAATAFGLDNGKKNVIADLDVLYAIIMQREKLLLAVERIVSRNLSFFDGFVSEGQVSRTAIVEARETLDLCYQGKAG